MHAATSSPAVLGYSNIHTIVLKEVRNAHNALFLATRQVSMFGFPWFAGIISSVSSIFGWSFPDAVSV